ncbi:MAG: phage holin family protein [Vicinamibacteria bacterium]
MENYRTADSRSIADILSDLKNETAALLREEVNLARVELLEKSRRVRGGAKSAIVGGVFAFGGFLALIAAAIFALDLALAAPWLSSLIVGFLLVLIGVACLAAARKQFNDLTPRETAESLRRNKELLEKHVGPRTVHTSA